GDLKDSSGYTIEDFGLHDNLMLEGGIRMSGGIFIASDDKRRTAFEECVIHVRKTLDPTFLGH
ncbi:MAG: nucleoside 2-deoxyribosyltransferase, partial [Thaumarchaeota archaeon]|nr:nucleoside 2-deoxyribosyltransferase [Nitrososphaerota archaeon]